MTILENLWFGNIKPSEDKDITSEEKELISLMARHTEKLTKTLQDDNLAAFNNYIDCSNEYTSIVEAQAFEIGFKLAVKMLLDK